ncbi:DUF982 domain-containing protein [Mesorhizobium sp. IMUNJ 23232]|uniref:DUF982 domain-containing protein n=1 Tax=Mesorhizobium sp. IMUNJ 23232 TaxID=3376064 RepID=UPI00379C1C23
MHNTLLFAPVAITTGLGEKTEISSLSEMREFLNEWAPARRRLSYGAAVKACEAARSGQCSPKAAREAFVAFAAGAGILWREEPKFIVVKPVAHGFGGFAI